MSCRSYRLTLKGEVGELVRRHAFTGSRMAVEQGNTVVEARDQAELMALLRRASDLGLTVLSVTGADERTHPTR